MPPPGQLITTRKQAAAARARARKLAAQKQARSRAFLAQATPDASWLARNPGLTRKPLTTVGGPAALNDKLRNEVQAWEQMRRQTTLAQKRGQFVGRPAALAAAPRGALGSQLKGFAQEGSAMAVGPSLASYLPGGPKPYFDPKDVALGLVGVFPFGRAGKLLRAGTPATRTLAHAGYSATLPAAGSLIGRGIENLSWAARTGGSKTKKIASEIQRTEKNVSLVKASPGEALRKVGRKLRADQQVALRLVAEGVPIDEQVAYYTKQATAAAVRGDKDSELAHRLHVALIQAARKHLLDLPTGPTLQPSKRVLAQAWGLLEKTSGTREEIAKSLGRLTEEGIAARIQMPGRIIKGAKFDKEVGAITGAEGFAGGKVYVPEARGVPGSTVVSPRSVSLQAGAIISGGWRRGITALGRDPSLTHAYKGALKESGLFRTDVTNLSASALAKAIRLDSIKRLRDILLTGARDTPDPAHLDDWVAIKVDPTKDLPGALKSFWDRWESKAGFTGREMERLGDDTAQTLRDALFPNIPPSLEPIANIKWVPKAMVDKIGMLNPFALKFPGSQSIGTRALKGSVDVYNDLERFAILFLNPAYGPVNFLGNTAMNLFQQGAFLPANWIKSVRLMTKMKAENVVALDGVIGRGLTATFSPITAGIKGVTAPVGGAIGTLTDLLPRRAAFFHEARRQGYRTHAEVDALFDAARSGDEVAMGNVDQIARRGNDAIIDYGRQSPVEQHIIGRILFFYPWVKGASRYTYRFPLEHPYQAAGLGYGGYKTKEYAEEKLGEDRPWYTQFDVPLPEGLAEELNKLGVGREGMPLVIGLRQLFPQATAVELAQSVYGFATGSTDMPQLAESLTPAIGNIVTAITGYDTFKQKEVGSGARTFLRQSYETLPPVRFYKGLTEEKSKQALYPRTKTDELIRIGLGGLAPKPFNPETAKRITTGDRGISTAARKRAQFVRDNPDLINPGYLPYAVKYRQMYEGVLAGQRSLAEGLGIKVGDNTYESGDQGLTPKQEYAVKLAVLKQVRPDVLTPELEKNFTAYFKPDSTDPEVAKWSEAFKTWINERLRFKDELGYGIDYLIDKAREKKKQLAG